MLTEICNGDQKVSLVASWNLTVSARSIATVSDAVSVTMSSIHLHCL